MRGHLLGELELVVLSAVAGNPDGYGLKIRQEIERLTGREVAIGSVYRCLSTLEKKGLVSSRKSDPQPVRGGRAKRHFQLTGEGSAALRRTMRDVAKLAGSRDLGLVGN